jgi:membrane protein YqaA with SNARE-associated domain
MRTVTHWVLTTFTSPTGILILAALDSTLFFWLPFGVDAATIVFSMRGIAPWWAVALLATGGSLAGALITFWMGGKVGDAGLDRFASVKHLESARSRIKKTTRAAALAALSLVPPPFPFTPIVLAAGALEVKSATFFATLAACRFARFGLEAFLARRYGPRTLDWLESPIVENAVLVFLVLGLVLTTLTLVRMLRAPARSRRRHIPARH